MSRDGTANHWQRLRNTSAATRLMRPARTDNDHHQTFCRDSPHPDRAYGRIRKPLRHNHPGESATRAIATHPDPRQATPMAASVGRPADSGSLLASRGSVDARFDNDVLPTAGALAICRKIPVRTGAPARSPYRSDGSTRALPRSRAPRQTSTCSQVRAFDSAATWRCQPQPDRREQMGINTFREVVDILDAAVSGPGTEVGPPATPSGAISLGMSSSYEGARTTDPGAR